jgi:hypothetical protein
LRIWLFAVDATLPEMRQHVVGGLYGRCILRRKTAMCLYDFVAWDSGLTLETINVLREELQQKALLVQQIYERVRNGWSEFSGV